MVKAPPQPPVADAAASSPTMQDRVGPRTTDGHDAKIVPGQQKPTIAAQEISRRDVHTASSINAQRRLPKSGAKEQNSAHRPAITRVNGKEAPRDSPPKSQSTTGSKPVLVRGPSTKSDMKKKHQPMNKSTSPKLPPVESFSFQDILSSIGPEANASIDAIAEICGRSKMSLAAEHKSHRPPQGKLVSTGSSPDTFFLPARLEPVAEMRSNRPHTRSMSRSLALTTGSAYSGDGLPSDPTAATSNVTSHTHTSTCRHGKGEGSTSTSASLLPQVLAWLLRSRSTTTNEQPSASDHDAGAISAMHRLLNDTSEAPFSGFVEPLDPGRYVTSAISHWRAAPTTEESDQTGGWETMFDRPACQHVGRNQSTIQCPSSNMISRGISTRTRGCIGKPLIPVIDFLRDGGQQIVFQTPTPPRGWDIAATFIEIDRQDSVFRNGKRSVDDRPGPRNRRAGKAEIAEPGGTRRERWRNKPMSQRAQRKVSRQPNYPEKKHQRPAQQAVRTMRVEP